MKYIKSFIKVLKRSSLVTSTTKKLIPEKLQTKIRKSLNKDMSIRLFFENDTASIDLRNKNIQGLVPVLYWDSKPNFGDLIGPYLISKITGKPVLNIINSQYSGIMAVGSIINLLDRKNMVVWGSGLIDRLTDKQMEDFKKYNPEILSVRGRETAKHLIEAGINVPEQRVYGDPALILPLFYKPPISSSKKIGICPHYTHKLHFLKNIDAKDNLKIIDVQKDMETVVSEISSSAVCVATSLHGLIIAQAYNVPWVWLEVINDNLIGNDFKFKDFFSTIDESQVAHVTVRMEEIKNLDFKMIAEKATLPDKLYNEALILEALKKYLQKESEY